MTARYACCTGAWAGSEELLRHGAKAGLIARHLGRAAIATGGTVSGTGRFLQERNPGIQVVGTTFDLPEKPWALRAHDFADIADRRFGDRGGEPA
ncbi:MAG TPA: hypothetical protein VJU58_13645 [Microbacterium sp.]|nr:hypothetical protein [Microbacterium sp.]